MKAYLPPTVEQIVERITAKRGSFDNLLTNTIQNLPKISHIYCLGIGSLKDSKIAQTQLAFLLDLIQIISPLSTFVFDPVFVDFDHSIIQNFNLSLQQNNHAKCDINDFALGNILFYMPHCGKSLYNNLLWKNWSKSKLERLFIFGNSFDNYQLLEKKSSAPSFVLRSLSFVKEVDVGKYYKLVDETVFNNSSIHSFGFLKNDEIDWDDRVEPSDNDPELK